MIDLRRAIPPEHPEIEGRYHPRLRALDGRSGVYAIIDRRTPGDPRGNHRRGASREEGHVRIAENYTTVIDAPAGVSAEAYARILLDLTEAGTVWRDLDGDLIRVTRASVEIDDPPRVRVTGFLPLADDGDDVLPIFGMSPARRSPRGCPAPTVRSSSRSCPECSP